MSDMYEGDERGPGMDRAPGMDRGPGTGGPGPGTADRGRDMEDLGGPLRMLGQAAWQGRTRVLLRNSAVVAVNLLYVKDVGLEHATRTGRESRSIDKPLPFAVPALIAVVLVIFRLG